MLVALHLKLLCIYTKFYTALVATEFGFAQSITYYLESGYFDIDWHFTFRDYFSTINNVCLYCQNCYNSASDAWTVQQS